MISLKNISLRRGVHLLLKDVNWTIYHKQRIGLIGANGSGKTSLFSLILNDIKPDDGEVTIPKQLRFSHVAQETLAVEMTAIDYVMDGDAELRMIEKQLTEAEAAEDGVKVAHLCEKMMDIDGYTAKSRAAQLLIGLGFEQTELEKQVREFSGGWRVRLNLAKALMCRSDILLLDEPTNHLDLDAVIWLEQWLQRYPGTLLLISHDRDFLDAIVDHIAHISHQALTLYSGNYSTFEQTHAQQILLQQAAFEKQQKQISHMQKFIDRFKAKASKARQAQSRMKALARMDVVCAVQTESEFQFHFKKPDKCPNPLLQLERAAIAYDTKEVLSGINLSITPSDRLGILGPNGAGKSSLVKLLAAEIFPRQGTRTASSDLKIGYFAQHQVDHLDLQATPLLHLQRIAPKNSEQELRTYLGSFGFSYDRVFEPIKNFSGGEKSRLALALLVWQKPNLLLLDEPTNHLDLEMRNALSIALQEYEGAMLLVSHDRFLLRSTTDDLKLVANGKLSDFNGSVDDYRQWLFDYRKQQSGSKKESLQRPSKAERPKRKNLESHIEKIENQMIKLEKDLAAIELELASAELYSVENKVKLQQYLDEQNRVKVALNHLEDDWISACEERDSDRENS